MARWIGVGTMVVAGVVMGAAPDAHAVPVRYASPTGSSSAPCTVSQPCDIRTAIDDAPATSEVVIESGSYGSAAHPLVNGLSDNAGELKIHGVAGKPMPVIYSNSSTDQNPAILIEDDSSVSDLALVYSGDTTGLDVEAGSADHVVVKAVGGAPSVIACQIEVGPLADSACIATGADGFGIASVGATTQPIALRGVTVEATGSRGIGLDAQTYTDAQMSIDVTNSIIHGAGTDIVSQEHETGDTMKVTVEHSDIKTTSHVATSGSTNVVTTDKTDISAAPRFVNARNLNFAEALGSPTVDRGAADPASDTDVTGLPRRLGSAPDMGAYEQKELPALGKVTAKASRTSAVVSVKVNPEGLPAKVTAVARLGKKKVKVSVSGGSGLTTKTLHLHLKHLKRHSTYKFEVAVTNSAGGVAAVPKHFTTK